MFPKLDAALAARANLIDNEHTSAFRLFSGFYEGAPNDLSNVVVDVYARTLLLWEYNPGGDTLGEIRQHLLEQLPWVECVLEKKRSSGGGGTRQGMITFGEAPAEKIKEHDLWHAIDLTMNQDASFYLDTRHLRRWLIDHAKGWSVYNAFAYTGSFGVAALAGGASRVIQGDLNRNFLALSRTSGMINKLDIGKMKLLAGDFFKQVKQFKKDGELFDCVIVDPPFFSTTKSGTVDLVNESVRVINKVRPLIKDGGRLITINNALFLSGAEYMRSLEKLCADGYLSIEELIPIPQDIIGYPHTITTPPPADPSPFNHSTKIAILKVSRK